MDGDRELYLSNGMDDYLSKPFSRVGLHQMLMRWLAVKEVPEIISNLSENTTPKMEFHNQDINTAILNSLSELEDEDGSPLLNSLIHTYIANSEMILKSLQDVIKLKDFEEIRRLAHALKSSSGNLGLEKVSGISRQIEYGCREHHTDDLDELYLALFDANSTAKVRLLKML